MAGFDDVDNPAIPVFRFPWPGACHPEVRQAEAAMIRWGQAHRLIPDATYLSRVVRTRYAYLAARCYPRVGSELLQAAEDYFLRRPAWAASPAATTSARHAL